MGKSCSQLYKTPSAIDGLNWVKPRSAQYTQVQVNATEGSHDSALPEGLSNPPN